MLLNNSVIKLDDVGQRENGLLCVTNRLACCGTPPDRHGDFYYPNGQIVPKLAASQAFWRDRGAKFVRLNRRDETTTPTGQFRCEIPDASGVLQNIFITLE